MKLKSVSSKIIMLILAGAISITCAGTASAAGGSNSRHSTGEYKFEKMSAFYKSAIDSLVKDGTLTQKQADTIESSMPKDGKRAHAGERKSPIGDLVEAGTITREQADSIRKAIKAAKGSDKTLSDVLKELVSEGTLTTEQAEAITSCMPKNGGWTHSGECKGPLSDFVANGTITQEQADAIYKAVKDTMDAEKKSD
ncbi:MAG: hypothetical protein AB7C97_03505 [Oscillospiraceae bacterium]